MHAGVSAPTSAHIAAGASPYVDDSHDMADRGASHSSPSDSSPTLGPDTDTGSVSGIISPGFFDLGYGTGIQTQGFPFFAGSNWVPSTQQQQNFLQHGLHPPYEGWDGFDVGTLHPHSHSHAHAGLQYGSGSAGPPHDGGGLFGSSGRRQF